MNGPAFFVLVETNFLRNDLLIFLFDTNFHPEINNIGGMLLINLLFPVVFTF